MEPNLLNWTQAVMSPHLDSYPPPADMHQAISEVKALPAIPATANRIMQLASDPFADAQKLAEIIELDPLLAAQVIRWASSSLYGYRGKISSVQNAITQVLGFNFVLNLALGLATLAPLRTPVEGTIGIRSLWVQALASTRIMASICQKMPVENRPPSDQIFLAGLLHNIGYPLLSHQFPDKFGYLIKLIIANPTLNITTVENFAFGYDHSQLGAWLMQTWSMPKPIVDIVYHHHNPNYRGDNYLLNLLVFVNDCLLGKVGIGDAINQECPDSVFQELGVSEEIYDALLDTLDQEIDGIKETVAVLLS